MPACFVEGWYKEAELQTTRNIVETAREAGSFTTLLAAVDAAGLLSAPTVQAGELPISSDGSIHVADANVVSADIESTNGLIHVIDRVLLPAAA